MRDAIDPNENHYHQAIIWVSAEKPAQFDAWSHESTSAWAGVRWHHKTLSDPLTIDDTSIALIVVDIANDDDLRRFPDWAMTLQSHGILIGAVIVMGMHNIRALNQYSREQMNSAGCMPPLIAAEHIGQVRDIQNLLIAFTYAPMLVCVDWFDVQVAAGQWARPCLHRQVTAETFALAVAEFKSKICGHNQIAMVVLVEPDFSIEHFTAIGDVIEDIGIDFDNAICTQIVSADANVGVSIHWLEHFSV